MFHEGMKNMEGIMMIRRESSLMLTASDQVEYWSRGVLITVEVQTYLVLILFNPITPILRGSSTPCERFIPCPTRS